MNLRNINPLIEKTLFIEAWDWEESAPKWFRDASGVFGPSNWFEFIEWVNQPTAAHFGVFEREELIAIITLTLVSKLIVENHLMCKRGADVELVTWAANEVKVQAFRELGLREAFSLIAAKNRPVISLMEAIGFYEDGIRILKGTSHGKVIEWVRVRFTREDYLNEQIKKNHNNSAAHASQHIRLYGSAGNSGRSEFPQFQN